MKKFEAKTTLLLALPALALLGFASVLSLRTQTVRAPQIVSNEVVRVPNTTLVCHRVTVTKNEFPWWCRSLLGGQDFGATIQGSKCDQLRLIAYQESEGRGFITEETYFLAKDTPKGNALFRDMVTWKKDANSQTRDQSMVLKKLVSLENLK